MCLAKTEVLQKQKSSNWYVLLQLLSSHYMSLPNLFGRCRYVSKFRIKLHK
ncbi:hypothetical protein NC653_019428 [Populus alba x Populus x berolinensis]|uniref:Uncharacterized protein n=1 Tax=Populus alba x Populus x berolinensis TaxID=444605 RepID=A0AAD6VX89_9ROSI|nr:hypothetical protein NC653_019428 [Populus alba x Populus x berolinensis]